ncbi:MAG: 4Fe-4S dicluster domain-containing protein, partial [Coriobacteriia bacterium]|nr:4Fe-4S dicluster domain-containing protein [Coriobacteriia bacterium]
AELLAEFGVGVAVLGVSLAGSLVYERFFCKYLCPTGALLGVLAKLSAFGIKRDADACIDCGICDKACPMNIAVSSADVVTDSECISCSECVNVCPAAGALEVKAPTGRSVSPLVMTGIVVAVIAAIIGTSTVTGTFAWKMPSLSEAVQQQGGAPGAAFDTSLIKGYMSLREISEASGIPEERFVETFGVPKAALGEPMKEIKDQYGFSPDEVRIWVAEELGQ